MCELLGACGSTEEDDAQGLCMVDGSTMKGVARGQLRVGMRPAEAAIC